MVPHRSLPLRLTLFVLLHGWLVAAAAAAPKLTLAEPVVNVGAVDCGVVLKQRFVLRNDGDAPLELSWTPPPELKLLHGDKSIAPNASGAVEVEADTSTLSLPELKLRIRGKSNDPAQAEFTLEIQGKLNFAVIAQPPYVRVISVKTETAASMIKLKSVDDAPFRVLEATSKDNMFTFSALPAGAATQHEIRAVLSPDWKVGPLVGWIDLRTDHPRRPKVRLHVSGFLRPALQASPPEMDFGNVPAAEGLKRSAKVTNYLAPPAEFDTPECASPFIRIETEVTSPGRVLELRVQILPGAPKGPFNATIRVRTKLPLGSTTEIPVRAVIQ